MFNQHYIIIDDFYHDPDHIRHMALSMPTVDLEANYAGVMTTEAFATENHKAVFEHLTGDSDLMPGTKLSGKFRFTLATDQYRQHIHFDPGPGQIWAGVVYLSLPRDYETIQTADHSCGTKFWLHNRTGLQSFPLTKAAQTQHGWPDFDAMKNFLDTEGLDESLWTLTLDVPMRYNRLVLFRPWMFHSPGAFFGDCRENCRLIQTFFLSTANAAFAAIDDQ